MESFFSTASPYYRVSSSQISLPLISTLTGFHDWVQVTRWVQLLITSNYNRLSTSKEQSAMRAELTWVIANRVTIFLIFLQYWLAAIQNQMGSINNFKPLSDSSCLQHQYFFPLKKIRDHWDSNPGQLGENQVCYLCAMQLPPFLAVVSIVSITVSNQSCSRWQLKVHQSSRKK